MDGAAYLGEERLAARPCAYSPADGAWIPRELATGLRGPGGLAMSLDDLVKWEGAWLEGSWGSAELRAALLAPPSGPHHPVLGPYAAGWMLQELGGLRAERHQGGAFGHSAQILRFPGLGVSVVTLSNRADLDAADLGLEVAKAVIGERFHEPSAPAPEALDEAQRAAFGRFWRDPRSGQPWLLLPRGERFVLVSLGDLRLELVAVSPERLEPAAAQAPFALALTEGGLAIERGEAPPIRLEPLPFPPDRTAPAADYAGRWHSADLDVEVVLEDAGSGRLSLRQLHPLLELPPFQPMGVDLFLCDRGAAMTFERDESGRATRMRMDTNRARGLTFQRAE